MSAEIGVMSNLTEQIGKTLQGWLDREHEYAFLVLSDEQGVSLAARVAIGDKHTVSIPLPLFLRPALALGAGSVTLAHSHPSGHLFVSDEDMRLTRHVLHAATLCGLTLTDHVIVTPSGGALSMVAAGKLAAAPKTMLAAAENPQ